MTDEEFVQYRDTRYKEALEYYDDRAKRCQRGYHFLSVYVLGISVAISPILTLDVFDVTIFGLSGRVLAAILSPTVALTAGILAHFKLHENWLSYRSMWDALKHEEHFRNSRTFEYGKVEDRNKLFVERTEMLISSEGQEWLCRQMPKGNKDKDK